MTTRRWSTAAAMALATLAVSTKASAAQNGYRDRGQHRDDRNRWNHRFNDHDRRITRGWFDKHRRHLPRGMRRQDRLPPSLEPRLHVGIVLVQPLRGRMYAVPVDLLYQLPAVPYGYRYVFIGGRIVLVDPGYRVVDVMWLDLW